MPVQVSREAVFSLYRSFLRQTARLPHHYLRQFWMLRGQDEVKRLLASDDDVLRRTKLKRVRKDVARLEMANTGDRECFAYVLDMAYGRKGPLKHAIMKPLLSDPSQPKPPRIIPAAHKSHPPVYSPELAALSMSGSSRRQGKPLKPEQLVNPPTMPARADPSSSDYQLFGPLSKRREVNIKWRFFTENWQKLHPPIELTIDQGPALSTKAKSIERKPPRAIGIPGQGLLEDVITLAGASRARRPPIPRRQRQSLPADEDAERRQGMPMAPTSADVAPSRFIRRRYAELLGKIPILTYTRTGKYVVALDDAAWHQEREYPLAEVDDTERAWLPQGFGEIERAKKADKATVKG
ncbi:hypothetical protein PENSPDRAFT_645301 [Peniophora sp. CONT]|nr:hypothetical protein PENSPDRAFT_645301 [Peniophora sp. CONT]